jgi:uncharacterized protein (DUF58 family)
VRRRYVFGRSGIIYCGVTLLIALGAFNSQNNLLFWAFGFAIGGLIVSGLISGAMLMGVDVARESVGRPEAGDDLVIRYRVSNRNRFVPAFALSIDERTLEPAAKPGWIVRLIRGRKRRRGDFARCAPARAFASHVGARQTVHVEARAATMGRGPVSFDEILVHSAFPFGLLRKMLRFQQAGSAVILAKSIPDHGRSFAPAAGEGWQASEARRSGGGDEFFALRDYRQGDALKTVAWRPSAKRSQMLVKQMAAPSPVRAWIVLRVRVRPGSEALDERAISVAAGLLKEAEARGLEYGLAVPLLHAIVPPRRGAGHLSRVLTELGLLDLGADDGRGERMLMPTQTLGHRGLTMVVHSGQVDASFAMPGGRETVVHVPSIGPEVGL